MSYGYADCSHSYCCDADHIRSGACRSKTWCTRVTLPYKTMDRELFAARRSTQSILLAPPVVPPFVIRFSYSAHISLCYPSILVMEATKNREGDNAASRFSFDSCSARYDNRAHTRQQRLERDSLAAAASMPCVVKMASTKHYRNAHRVVSANLWLAHGQGRGVVRGA